MIVEDDEVVLQELSALLALEPGILITAQVTDGINVLEQLEKDIIVNVMLVDWNMPNMNGLELTRLTKTKKPGMKIIILTMHGKQDSSIQAMDAGMAAYVFEDLDIEELAKVIREVYIENN